MMTVTRPRLRVDSAIADRDRPDGPCFDTCVFIWKVALYDIIYDIISL